MNIQVGTLVLEITRKCNMRCDHCLRGDAQKLDMSHEIMNRVLDQISWMSSVTFTGGDPSLNVNAINHFTDAIRCRKIGPDNFYVVTNGKRNANKLAMALINLYGMIGVNDQDEMTSLNMSRDPFHEEVPVPAVFKALRFFQEDGHVMKDTHYLISEGRAKRFNMGTRNIEIPAYFENTNGYDEDSLYLDTLYIAANGNVLPVCDLSYDRIDSEHYGNVLTTPLSDIIEAHTLHEEAVAA